VDSYSVNETLLAGAVCVHNNGFMYGVKPERLLVRRSGLKIRRPFSGFF
jgi:hypothetical protein